MRETKFIFLSCLMAAWIAVGAWNTVLAQNSDVSDTYWSIVVPTADAFDVDMGQAYVTETRDSVISGFLKNVSTVTVRVDSVVVTGNDASDFQIWFDHVPFHLSAGEAASVTCRFTPGSIGRKIATLVVYTQADTIVRSLSGEGLSSDIQVVPDVIDFGVVEVDSDKDTTIVGAIRNTGNAPLTIERTLQIGPDHQQFVDISGEKDFTIDAGGSRSMTIRFSPRKSGRTSGRLLLRQAGSGATKVVYLYGDGRITRGIVEAAVDTVSFGPTSVGSVMDTTIIDALRNVGEHPLLIKRIELQEAGGTEFACRNIYSDFGIPPGEAASLDLRYSPTIPGKSTGQLLFHHDGLGSPAIFHLVGIATAISGTATLGIDTVFAFVGGLVRLPILLKDQHDLVESGTRSVSMELRYNASLLSPAGTTPFGRLESGNRIIPLEALPVETRNGDTLAVLEFLATLGNAAGTPLILEQLSADNGNSTLTSIPGYFALLGLCEEGGARLVDAGGILSLEQNHPNPFNARTAITFEIIEHGPTRLLVKDLFGRTVATIVDRWLESGCYAHSFDASTLPSGSYFCILQTPTRQLMRRMEVVK